MFILYSADELEPQHLSVIFQMVTRLRLVPVA